MRLIIGLVFTTAAFVAAGCGGDSGTADGTTIPADEYVAAADELCAQVAQDVSALGGAAKLEEIATGSGSEEQKMEETADVLEQQLEVIMAFREDLEALGTPSTGADDVEALLEQTRSSEEELSRAVEALRDGDAEEATEALQRYYDLSLDSASGAEDSELDFAVCGAGA